MQKITPFLWFDGYAEEAMDFYVSTFKEAKINSINKLPNGKVLTTSFSLFGQNFVGLNGGPNFKFNEAVSFCINCSTQEEVDYYWNTLTADGGEESMCGWLKDKFGLSWQVVPEQLPQLLNSGTQEQSKRVMDAMLQMRKIDINQLEAAFND